MSDENKDTAVDAFYTMAEAAQVKGCSYHTVSRAVRRGLIPVTRIGRMALIAGADLRGWRPIKEKAPRKYPRKTADLTVVPTFVGEVRS